MRVFRISQAKYTNDLSGKGAELYGGRWNPVGYPVLYTAGSLSLAMLEIMVNSARDRLIPPGYQVLTLDIPDDSIDQLEPSKFFALRKGKNYAAFQQTGKAWLDICTTLALQVPSVVVPSESNHLLNPSHARYPEIRIVDIQPLFLDSRLME